LGSFASIVYISTLFCIETFGEQSDLNDSFFVKAISEVLALDFISKIKKFGKKALPLWSDFENQ